jgi:CPA2 family monovalent cation:H+ antiporter-2
MPTLPILRDLVLLVAVAIPTVALAQRLRIPGLIGFLATGMVIGPNALALVRNPDSVATLAEIGVVLLVFAIGLEMSLAQMIRMGRAIVQGSTLQMVATIAGVAIVAILLGQTLGSGLVWGGMIALTSSAVMLKVYADLGGLDGPAARIAIPVSLFQDLWVIPLVLMVEVLGGEPASFGASLVDITVSIVVISVLVFGGRLVIPRVLAQLARLQSRELFTLSIMFLGVGAAYVTQSFGLSLATGAFLAGLVISESDYGAQALSDVVPFRDAFGGLFFVAVGMLLDIRFVLAHPVWVFGLGLGVVLLKGLTGTLAVVSLRRPVGISVAAGLALTPIGEFSFILASMARAAGLLGADAYQLFLATSMVTIVMSPVLTAWGTDIGNGLAGLLGRHETAEDVDEAATVIHESGHVIVVGYGLNGRSLARVLDAAGIPYVVIEQNGNAVELARLDLQPIMFGDATRIEVLRQAGIERARCLVFAISSPADEARGVTIARRLNPTLHIVVRTRYVRSMADLTAAGADEVVPEEFETSLAIFSRVLRHYNIPSNTIEREVQAARAELYGMLPADEVGALQLDTLAHLGVHHAIAIVEVETGCPAVGEHPTTLNIRRDTGATVITVVRAGQAHYTPDADFRFAPGDSVVLVGDDESLDKARALFVKARGA